MPSQRGVGAHRKTRVTAARQRRAHRPNTVLASDSAPVLLLSEESIGRSRVSVTAVNTKVHVSAITLYYDATVGVRLPWRGTSWHVHSLLLHNYMQMHTDSSTDHAYAWSVRLRRLAEGASPICPLSICLGRLEFA